MQYGSSPVYELADMHLTYGRADGKSRDARRLYHETFPRRQLPNHETLTVCDRRLRETEHCSLYCQLGDRECRLDTDLEEHILDREEENLAVSSRRRTAEFAYMTVWKVL